jgi:DUF4097 and DUF4098 domain-containing protein YvlB
MTTKHLTTVLLLVASLALAGPALAQSDPCKERSKLAELSRLADLAQLGQLSQLAALSQLEALSQVADLPQLGQLPPSRDLSRFRDLSRLRALGQDRQPSRRSGPEQTERFTKTFRVGRTGSLDLSNVSGDITVTAGPGEDIVIDATKRTRRGADAQGALQSVTIEAVERAGRVEVHTRYPERANNIHTSVDYVVTVPAGASVNVHSISGDIHVTGVKGALRADAISGDVGIENADQIEQLKSFSGDVTVSGGAGTDVRASVINGDLTLRNVKARSLDVMTVSGDVKVIDAAADRAGVKTISGAIEYTGPFARNGRYEFKAHSGDVRLMVTSNTGFEINADTFSGSIQSTVPLTLKEGELPAPRGRRAVLVRREMKGTYGDGSALVTVSTFSGDVTIAKR